MQSPEGSIISYSTQAGRTAADGAGPNSPNTSSFLGHIEDKEDIATVFRRISADVYETTKGTQVPELSRYFFGEFYLKGKLQLAMQPLSESLFWDSIKDSRRSLDFDTYLKKSRTAYLRNLLGAAWRRWHLMASAELSVRLGSSGVGRVT